MKSSLTGQSGCAHALRERGPSPCQGEGGGFESPSSAPTKAPVKNAFGVPRSHPSTDTTTVAPHLHHICTTSKRRSALRGACAAGAQVDRGVVTGGRVDGGRDAGLVAGVVGETEVLGGFPPPPPLVDANAIATAATIATTATIAATTSHMPCDLSSSLTLRPVVAASSSRSCSTRAPQWGQNVAPGVSGSSHIRQRPVAVTIRRPV